MDPHYFGFTVVVLLKNFLLHSLPTRTLMNEIIDNDIFSILTVVVVALKKGTLCGPLFRSSWLATIGFKP